MENEDWWFEAIRQRAEAAEAKFAKGEPLTQHDTVAVALHHPEKFEIMVKAK